MMETGKAIKKLLADNFAVSMQWHIKPGGNPRYTVIVRRVETDERGQGWGSTAAEALEDLHHRTGLPRPEGEYRIRIHPFRIEGVKHLLQLGLVRQFGVEPPVVLLLGKDHGRCR